MKMSIIEGRRRLAFLWGSGSFLALLVLIVEIYGKVWGSVAPEAFGWCLLMVMPSLILIAGSVVAEQAQKKPSRPEAMSLAFWLTFWVSVSYLAFVSVAVVAAAWDEKPILVLKTSSPWLLPLQDNSCNLPPITSVSERGTQVLGNVLKRPVLASELKGQNNAVCSPLREKGRKFVRIAEEFHGPDFIGSISVVSLTI